MPKKLTMEEVKKRLLSLNSNVEVLEKEYKNAKTKMNCSCKTCNHMWKTNWDCLKRGQSCPMCNGANKPDIRDIKEYVRENSSCDLISDKYINCRSKLTFKCRCGKLFERTYNEFRRRNKTCADCSYKGIRNYNGTTIEEILKIIESRKHDLINSFSKKHSVYVDLSDEYGYKYRIKFICYRRDGLGVKFGKQNPFYLENIQLFFKKSVSNYILNEVVDGKSGCHLKMTCDRGHEFKMYFYNFKKGHRCQRCFSMGNVGENHPNFKKELTDEDRYKSRYLLYGKSQKKWSRKVHEKHGFKCFICNSNKNIEAHHIESWSSDKEKRFDLSNGVTLCKNHHLKFHKKYGFGYNNSNQFLKYVNEEKHT